MKKLEKICSILLIISLLISAYFMINKIIIETNNSKVEISVPANEVKMLSVAVKQDPVEILKRLKQAGLTSLVIQETTLRDMVDEGRALILNGWQLLDHQRFLGITADVVKNIIAEKDFNPVSYYVFTKDKKAFDILKEFIPQRGYEIRAFEGDGLYVIQEVKGIGGFSNIGLGFDQSWMDTANELGLNLDIYVREMQQKTKKEIEFLVSNLEKHNISILISQNNQIPRAPDGQQLLADYLKRKQVLLGIDEFVNSGDILALAQATDYQTVRVYNRPLHKWMDEYLLAVRDRNDRMLFLHLFLSGQEDLVLYNEEHICEIANSIKSRSIANDFTFEKAESFSLIRGNWIFSFIASLGVLWCLTRLIILAKVPEKAGIGIVCIGLAGLISMALLNFSLYRDMISFAIAVLFPVLGLYGEIKSDKLIEEEGFQGTIGCSVKGFIKAIIIAFFGAVLLWGVCADTKYLLGLKQFRGIKLLYILPYIFIIILFLRDNYRLSLKRPIFSLGNLLMFAILGIVFYVLINRTGNFSVIPIPKWEISFRIWLENALLVRPRTKEFLIGFPALLVAEGLKALGLEKYSNWLYLIALLGLVSMVNTFTHFHISSLISIIRSLEGIIIGMMIGAVVLGGLYLYEKRRTKFNA